MHLRWIWWISTTVTLMVVRVYISTAGVHSSTSLLLAQSGLLISKSRFRAPSRRRRWPPPSQISTRTITRPWCHGALSAPGTPRRISRRLFNPPIRWTSLSALRALRQELSSQCLNCAHLWYCWVTYFVRLGWKQTSVLRRDQIRLHKEIRVFSTWQFAKTSKTVRKLQKTRPRNQTDQLWTGCRNKEL